MEAPTRDGVLEFQVCPGEEVRGEGSRAESTEKESAIFPQVVYPQRTDRWTSGSSQGVAERMIWPAKPGLEKGRRMGGVRSLGREASDSVANRTGQEPTPPLVGCEIWGCVQAGLGQRSRSTMCGVCV